MITHSGPKNLDTPLLGDISLWTKWLWHKADHSPPSSAEVKNEWNCILTPTYAFKVSTGIIFPVPFDDTGL